MKQRLECPKKKNKYYNNKPHGGLSDAVNGSPMISGLTVLDNCVGWANSRYNEIINDPNLEGIVKAFRYQLVCNAENFIESAKKQGLKISSVPVVGGIMVWQKGRTLSGSDGAGHVAVVEAVYDDGSILTSESGWASWTFKTVRRYNNNGRWGQNSAYKFRGCIINPAVDGKPVPAPKLVVDGIGGMATVMAMQEYFGTPIDGSIGGQNKNLKKYYPALTAVTYGGGGSPCIKALQKWCGAEADGVIGLKTVKKWQKKLGVTADGIFGVNSMKAWQKYLNGQLHDDGGKTPSEPKKQPYKGDIVDVSEFQSEIDWSKVKGEGIVGAIVRCGYRGAETAKLKQDPMFTNHINRAYRAGLKVGIYFFTQAVNAKEGKEEAAYALNLAQKVGLPLSYPIGIDSEDVFYKDDDGKTKAGRANGISKAKRTEAVKAFCEEIKAQGYEPMIYASTDWLNGKLDMSKLPYKVWVAQWGDKVTYKGSYVLWQFTSKASISGVKGNCDVSKPYFKDETPKVETPSAPKRSVDAIAIEVINGKWGSGEERKKRITDAGYDYDAVQKRVTAYYTVADEVIDGKWGSGETRKKKLIEAGYDYDTVQKIVTDKMSANWVDRANAWAYKISDSKLHYVIWKGKDKKTQTCPICTGRKYDDHYGGNCIWAAFAYWHHGGGIPCNCNCHVISNEIWEKILNAKTDAEALKIAQSHVDNKDIEVIRNKKGIPKKQWKAGDIGGMWRNGKFGHAFAYMGGDKVFDCTQSGGLGNKNNLKVRKYNNYSALVIIRYKGK